MQANGGENGVFGKIRDYFRMWVWAALGVAALMLIGRPEQVLVVIYKGSLVSIAAFVGYWVDRNLFGRYRMPDEYMSTRELCRGLIVAATILAFALAL